MLLGIKLLTPHMQSVGTVKSCGTAITCRHLKSAAGLSAVSPGHAFYQWLVAEMVSSFRASHFQYVPDIGGLCFFLHCSISLTTLLVSACSALSGVFMQCMDRLEKLFTHLAVCLSLRGVLSAEQCWLGSKQNMQNEAALFLCGYSWCICYCSAVLSCYFCCCCCLWILRHYGYTYCL